MNLFVSKKSDKIIFRPPEIGDVDKLKDYINELSAENTYLRVSGEVFTRDEEYRTVESSLFNIRQGDKVQILAFLGNQLVGNCNVDRNFEDRKRGLHVGVFGLSIKKEFRGQGIGLALARATIELAQKSISGLKMIKLMVYQQNIKAISMYKKLGFVQVGQIPKAILYKGKYYDELIMVLSF